MFKLIISLVILTISAFYLISASGPYDTLAQCQAVCKDNNPCNKKECLWYYGYFCDISPLNCDDTNACTTDSCTAAGTCSNIPINCDDNNPCTFDYCHGALGCIHVTQDCNVVVPCNKTADCQRGKRCETYKCISGRCDYDPVVCPPELPCSEGSGACINAPTN
ncbi:hypothetical protein DICPUDRAFT_153725 [Dictyostelium purpureum]|uniref:Dickkopf N-terminal cysteine-rich domain-containing protein n=1 Tax=Dictyostelium purpureum TaxID=5786 RepID=F0ZPL5_DICPU|nr:uncharacterized protein DICPUDRAFT_153725 [Dictyostelium purpureum]EGC34107.1 hypothetical protein DICPUDRAFT_153725 [Dictyostelium purpureum]|eukprot:XP_003289353.1 hypothetical protein DICPUDRAFT_153725 [Dictyostelium purpureum]